MKKIFGMVAIAIVALAATMNVHVSLNETAQLSDLQLENIEALAASPEASWGSFCCQIEMITCWEEPGTGFTLYGFRQYF